VAACSIAAIPLSSSLGSQVLTATSQVLRTPCPCGQVGFMLQIVLVFHGLLGIFDLADSLPLGCVRNVRPRVVSGYFDARSSLLRDQPDLAGPGTG